MARSNYYALSKTDADNAFKQTFETQGGSTAMIARKQARIDEARNKVLRRRRAAAAKAKAKAKNEPQRVAQADGYKNESESVSLSTNEAKPRAAATSSNQRNTPAVTPRTKPKPPKTRNPLDRSSISGKRPRVSRRGKIRGYGMARGGRVVKSS